MSMSGIFRKSFLFGLQKGRDKIEKLDRGFLNTLLGKANPYSYFQLVYQRSCSFCCNIFENFIDIIILPDILLSLIGALFKYLFLCFTTLRYLFFGIFHNNNYFLKYFYNKNSIRSKLCFENINININKSDTSYVL